MTNSPIVVLSRVATPVTNPHQVLLTQCTMLMANMFCYLNGFNVQYKYNREIQTVNGVPSYKIPS